MIREEFEKALEDFEEDFQKGKVTKSQFDRLDMWHQLLEAKVDAERVQNAKEIIKDD